MKKQIVLGFAAAASVVMFSACDGSKDVAEKYLDANLTGDTVAINAVTKGDHQGMSTKITNKEKSGNEVIYTYDVMKADGSVVRKNQILVVFKDQVTGNWLVDTARSAAEQAKRDAAARK